MLCMQKKFSIECSASPCRPGKEVGEPWPVSSYTTGWATTYLYMYTHIYMCLLFIFSHAYTLKWTGGDLHS